MSAITQLSSMVGAAFEAEGLDPSLGTVVVSGRSDLGHFQCNGALPAAKAAGANPRDLAERIAERLRGDERFSDVSATGPGFINIRMTDAAVGDLMAATSADARLGITTTPNPIKVIVDYAGPNVAKSMHVGHLRATIIGESLKRLFRYYGHEVLGDAHFGDWGLQMGMLIVATREHQPELVYFDEDFPGPYPTDSPVSLGDLQRWYPEVSERAKTDAAIGDAARSATTDLQSGRPGYVALWEHFVRVSRDSQERDFADLGIEFDLWYGESTVRDRLRPLITKALAEGSAVESDGALVIEVAEPGDRSKMNPLIVQTSHGAFLYGTTDLATVGLRVEELEADLILYVVDARQGYHFEQVFRAARKTGIAADATMEHIKFGTMNGPDGKPFKTREGGVLRLRDLIDLVAESARNRLIESDIASKYDDAEQAEIARKVGVAALKFGDLINNRSSNYVFDLDRFTSFVGKTGPYLQMAAVRMKSILRKAGEQGLTPGVVVAPAGEAERNLMLRLLQLPEVVERAVELRAPSQMAEYAFAVASDFSTFYEVCNILRETDANRQASWLTLVDTTLRTIDLLLYLLGIEIPERM